MKQEVIYKGEDPGKLSSFEIEINKVKKKFNFRDFKKLTESDFDNFNLASQFPTQPFKKGPESTFRGVANLPLYYFQEGSNIILISHGEEQQGLYSIVLYGVLEITTEQPSFHNINYLDDPEIMGVTFPQMKDFYNPPSKEIYSDRNYARNHASFLPSEMRMDLFEVKANANKTDFISAGYLKSNGFFIRKSIFTFLKDFNIPDAKFIKCKAFQNNEGQEIYFINVLESSNILLQNSTYQISGGMHSSIDEKIHFETLDQLRQKKKELVRTPERPSLLPFNIKIKDGIDFIKIPGTIDFFISDKLLNQLKKEQFTGYNITKAAYKVS